MAVKGTTSTGRLISANRPLFLASLYCFHPPDSFNEKYSRIKRTERKQRDHRERNNTFRGVHCESDSLCRRSPARSSGALCFWSPLSSPSHNLLTCNTFRGTRDIHKHPLIYFSCSPDRVQSSIGWRCGCVCLCVAVSLAALSPSLPPCFCL